MKTSERVGIRLIAVIAGLVAALMLTGVQTAAAGNPSSSRDHADRNAQVLPARAQPLGFSLRDMTRELAAFTTSGNDPSLYPATPFQILYTAGFDPRAIKGGVTTFGTNEFTVRKGTKFFVPLQNATDSPPVIGTWPSSSRGAQRYFFDRHQLGAQGYKVIIDGKSTRLGKDYVAGPVRVAEPLGDGGGHEIITLGAFIEGFTVGEHTVRIVGQIAGDLVQQEPINLAFFGIDFTYRVTVTR